MNWLILYFKRWLFAAPCGAGGASPVPAPALTAATRGAPRPPRSLQQRSLQGTSPHSARPDTAHGPKAAAGAQRGEAAPGGSRREELSAATEPRKHRARRAVPAADSAANGSWRKATIAR